MGRHDSSKRTRARAFRCRLALGAALLLTLSCVAADAGILRDVMAKMGIGKPPPPTNSAGGTPTFPRQGFTCCNLHFDGEEISDNNHAELPVLAAGTPVTVMGYGRNRANIDVEGKPMRLSHDEGRDKETLDDWVNKLVTNDDPRARIAAYPANVQAAIKVGKVMLGMTREQALVAVGYPLPTVNKSLEEPIWRLWNSRRGEYQLNFGPDGRVMSITGDGEVTSKVIFLPPRH